MKNKLDELVTMSQGARLAKMNPNKFTRLAKSWGLAIQVGGGTARKRFKVLWPEFERKYLAQKQKPDQALEQPVRSRVMQNLNSDVRC